MLKSVHFFHCFWLFDMLWGEELNPLSRRQIRHFNISLFKNRNFNKFIV